MTTKDRIISVSKKLGLTHLSSNLTACTAIEAMYETKEPNEKFVLSNGHAGLALYLVTHPDDDECLPIQENIHADAKWADCSTGSLGHGLGIAVGMALANRHKNVYCMISDGEFNEGSIMEALRIAAEQKLINLKVVMNCNGYGAYCETNPERIMTIVRSLGWGLWLSEDNKEDIILGLKTRADDIPIMVFNVTTNPEPFTGLKGHYDKA